MSSDSKTVDREEDIKGQKWPWTPSSAILITIASYIIAQLVGGLGVTFYPLLRHWSTSHTDIWLNSVPAQFLYVLISEALTLVILWLYIKQRVSIKQLGLTRIRWSDALVSIIGACGYYGLYVLSVALITIFVALNTNQQQDVGFNHVSGAGALVMALISLVILPPLVEEITFRGFLYGGLRRRFRPLTATLITSCLFAVPHLLESGSGGLLWIAGLDTFILSLVLCYLREKTGRLWAGVGVHIIKNSVAFISLFIVHMH